jgi:DNA uptake protein ComE-like DNA-binding protein
MKDFLKKTWVFGLLFLSLSGLYHLTYELLLWKETRHQASWITDALESVNFRKFDQSVFRENFVIHPLSPQAKEKLQESLKVDINRASLEELISLPKIGPAIAQRIIDERSRMPFSKWADLARVKGLGSKNLEVLESLVKFDPVDKTLPAIQKEKFEMVKREDQVKNMELK